jgi:hypothetical protein
MKDHPLVRRKELLLELGLETLASRSSWSHDLGSSIVFDAWEHRWERDAQGTPLRYPLRTNGPHYNLRLSQQQPRRGHTRWQRHVDLVVAGTRTPQAIVPVANDPKASPNRGAKGWHSYFVEGHVQADGQGQIWLHADHIIPSSNRIAQQPRARGARNARA